MRKNNKKDNDMTPTEIEAVKFAWDVQDALNMVAVVGHWHHYLLLMFQEGMGTDAINLHPSTTLIIGKLIALNDFTDERESKAIAVVRKLVG
jgi:hypothetical protein